MKKEKAKQESRQNQTRQKQIKITQAVINKIYNPDSFTAC